MERLYSFTPGTRTGLISEKHDLKIQEFILEDLKGTQSNLERSLEKQAGKTLSERSSLN